jgi:stress-induced morphogen
VRAPEFKGKSLVEQHQMVYRALGDLMRGPIHALALDTKEA